MKCRQNEKLAKGTGKIDGSRRGRKARKQLENVFFDYSYETEVVEGTETNTKSYYRNYQHLSNHEKSKIENCFTEPKNKSQTDYSNVLKNKLNNKAYLMNAPKEIVQNDKNLVKELTIEDEKLRSIVSSIN